MYNGVNLVGFPNVINNVTRALPSVIPISIDAPTFNGVSTVKGSPKGSPDKYINEYVIDRKVQGKIDRLGFDLFDDFESAANIFNIGNMVRTTQDKYSGTTSMRSIKIGAGKTTSGTLNITLTQPMILTFKYTVRSESRYDWFRCTVNGTQVFNISGEPAWATYTNTLQPGTHKIVFIYSKDGSVDRSHDGGFIDDVQLKPVTSDAKSLVKIDGKYYKKTTTWLEVSGDTEYSLLVNHGMTDLSTVNDNDPFIAGKNFSIVTLSSTVNDLSVAGKQNIPYRYRIELGGQPFSSWSNISTDKYFETIRIFSADMEGSSTKELAVKFEIGTDSYKESVNVTIDNEFPTIELENVGLSFSALIDDVQGDLVKYRVLMNGEQVYPLTAEAPYESVPVVYNRSFLSNQVVPGTINEIKFEITDYYGGKTVLTHKFFANYVGLMFHDENHKYYSTDLGEVLKLLALQPKIMAGASTLPSKVFVTNEYTFPVKNVKIYGDNPINGTTVHFSKEGDPFIAKDVIDMGEHIYNVGEGFYFYVRMTSHHSALAGGTFDIVAEAVEVD